ncbi:carboxylesterase [Luteimonas aestuarii]|uniref:Carboxylesterase n=1 Tax=Luteimonas aestuarii TaxID=453837 RepID=A0A4R5TK78_9GAMM|nr:dienelactone hydrolase family protein [Luteimonas aestuarii]TDK22724.1 carboxylesterase [Luteimonas aestuarii]
MTDLLEAIEHETGAAPRWSVLWLHGLGADGNDFAPIVPELVRRDWPAIRFVFPHAPVRAVTINNGMRMRAWYDIRDFDLANRADEQGVMESVAQVEALIAREQARGVPASRIVLAGFSQGGAIALAAGLRRTEPLAGLVGLSTYLPAAQSAAAALADGATAQPVFMAHGSQDPVVPLAAGEQSAALLQRLGFEVAFHRYPMPHSVCAEEVAALGDWLSQRFTAG